MLLKESEVLVFAENNADGRVDIVLFHYISGFFKLSLTIE
jgi:hypothetical protein